ncbi:MULTISPECIES: flavin-containing monooxygenase [Burkholderia]|uniref:Pentalenolactone D synthase n=1 Tax=Burkholderia pseudomultivorans TaxID=1207504 RepID=A0ABU2EAJ9_9BURK|nr:MULTISPECIES: NAD(P)/FAD-dependent oxidoreductase [Burkholderia]EED99770.1 cyclohexanone monooxygenase [Burkholderia multivorans CGD1]MBR8428607.1 NAD(P)/FAD-dependent oxidoreductase [Burkholderia cenocepacia]MDN7669416.1 NAD(P)/FAD-dependent oxidoreductase [Burkholderia vietnamiensis]MDR8730482.1 Pentalenolactone D synthase [Burkholderia pseudomultivorans]MDR8738399.1 Pentalenolactone D synthase [Burkholderia pseudomultivorans]
MSTMNYGKLTNNQVADVDVDPDVLRENYRQERDKRINPKQNNQWTEIKGDFTHYVDDPYVEPGFTRSPVIEEVDVVVVGGGFGGLLSAAKLRQAGINSFRIIEKGGDFGGTWYWNRYPGAQCDIEAYIYMPLLEETGYIPTQKYAYAPEIFEHAQRIGRRFDLYPAALFQTQIKEMRWSDEDGRWAVVTDRDDVIKARFVISASGPLNRPKLPGIPGIGTFKGHTFHTSRWDYRYTGGNNRGGMTELADKRVAIVGTGATAIQCVPYVGQDARQLYVFQRTPSMVDVRGNRPTDPEWVKTLKPGWQQRRTENFNTLVAGGDQDEDLVHDGWTDIIRSLKTSGVQRNVNVPPEQMARDLELADFRKGNQVRARVDSIVREKRTAEGLKAWFRTFCKRPAFNDEYLPTFNLPSVTLVDTQGRGIDRITENALVFDGVEYEVDCIIFATGFETGTEYTRRSGFEVYGRGGKTLSEHHAKRMKTLHGFYSHGFPNFFILGISQNGFKPNLVDMLGEQTDHVLKMLKYMKAHKLTRIEPTAEAEEQWQDVIREKSTQVRAFLAECTPGYYSGEGDVDKGLLVDTYGGGSLEFTKLLNDWHADGQMKGLERS